MIQSDNSSTVHQGILHLLNELSCGSQDQCLKACNDISSTLFNVPGSEDTYCLNRLIRGLSCRQTFARGGYPVALRQILKSGVDITETRLLELSEKLLVPEERESKLQVALGRLLLLFATIPDGTALVKLNGRSVTLFSRHLEESLQFPGLREAATSFFCDLLRDMTQDLFDKLSPLFLTDLEGGWRKCTPSKLLLALYLSYPKYFLSEKLVKKSFFANHWESEKIVAETNLENILEVLKLVQTVSTGERLLDCLLLIITRSKQCLGLWNSFFQVVVNDGLLRAGFTHKLLGFEAVWRGLKLCSSTEQISNVLSEQFLYLFIRALGDFRHTLHPKASLMAARLLLFMDVLFKEDTSSSTKLNCLSSEEHIATFQTILFERIWSGVVRAGMEHPNIGKFMGAFVSLLHFQAARKAAVLLCEGIFCEPPENRASDNAHRLACVTLRMLAKHARTHTDVADWKEFHMECSKFFFLHSTFALLQDVKESPLCCNRENGNETVCRGFARRQLRDEVIVGLTFLLQDRMGVDKVFDAAMHFRKLLLYAKKLLSNTEVYKHRALWSEKTKEQWLLAVDTSNSLYKEVKEEKTGNARGKLAFCLSFQYLALHALLFGNNDSELPFQDLFSSFRMAETNNFLPEDVGIEVGSDEDEEIESDADESNSNDERKSDDASLESDNSINEDEQLDSDSSEENLDWLGSLLEIHLGLATFPSRFTRGAISGVLSALTPILTPSSLSILLNVLRSNNQNGEFSFHFSEVRDVQSDEESADDCDKEMNIDELKEKVFESDEDSDSERILNDEEMGKMDKALAAAVRAYKESRSGGKKKRHERQTQLSSFKTRCLHFLSLIIGRGVSVSVITSLVVPLLQLCIRDGGKNVAFKSLELISRVEKVLDSYKEASNPVAVSLCLHRLFKYAVSIKVGTVPPQASRIYVILMKLLTLDGRELALQELVASTRKLLNNRNVAGIVFVKSLCTRAPAFFFPLHAVVFNQAVFADATVFLQTKICEIARSLINRENRDKLLSLRNLEEYFRAVISLFFEKGFKRKENPGLKSAVCALILAAHSLALLPMLKKMFSPDAVQNVESLSKLNKSSHTKVYKRLNSLLHASNDTKNSEKKSEATLKNENGKRKRKNEDNQVSKKLKS